MSLSLLNQRPSTWPITLGKSAPTTSSEDNLSNSYKSWHPSGTNLSKMEKDNLRVMSVDCNPADKFVTYSWNNGWVWFYGHAVHLPTMLQEQLKDEQYAHTTLMTQCLQHLGQYGTTMLAADCQTMINAFRATLGLNTITTWSP